METLSELVERDYEAELKIINEAGGRLWAKWLALSILFIIFWGSDEIFGTPWNKRDGFYAIAFIVVFPFLERWWEQYKVAAVMRHEREVRLEVKLDALLGLVNIEEYEREK